MSNEPPSPARWRLILNGKAAGDVLLRETIGNMRIEGVDISVRVTWEAGDVERYVAEALTDRVDTVVAGGGDGTFSAAAGALAKCVDDCVRLPSLALLPMGTANDFAVAAEIPQDPAEALELVRRTAAQPIDLLHIDSDGQSRWCANLASGGFGTRVTVETRDGMKKLLGGLAYLITGISQLGRIEPIRARVLGPGFEWEGDFIALGVGNGRQAGAGQVLCPDALIDDGRLDLTIVPQLVGEVANTIGTLISEGKHSALDRVAVRSQLAWVEIRSEHPLVLNLDGEPSEASCFHIACVPDRVRMHLPLGCPLLRMPGNPLPLAGHADAPDPSPCLVPA
ncbi:MAG: lipid kinase YegS [Lysobacter sp.]|nr:lipid kinase YegS [Lysobacter sp.]